MFEKKDRLIFIVVIGIALLLFAVTKWIPGRMPSPSGESLSVAGETALTESSPSSLHEGDEDMFLVVSVGRVTYEPIRLEGDAEYVLNQKETARQNVIHVAKDSAWMASSTCENQNCVEQGIVSAENREGRLLRNMIVCLPNEVLMELLSRKEMEESIP